MGATIRAATSGDLEKLIPLLDEEFIFGKGRRVSLAQRFPAVYCRENLDNIFVAEENGAVVSALVAKRFNWLENGEPFRGIMFGAVYTHPLRRKEGQASRLLAWAAEKSGRDGTDFAVLWAAKSAFYARLGWVAGDCGVLGEAASHAIAVEPSNEDEVEVMPANLANLRPIEFIRQRWLDPLILRNAGNYRQLPPPAETVALLRCGENPDRAGYALAGYCGGTTIVYEMNGHPDSFRALWHKICGQPERIIINDQPGSASYRWLAGNTSVTWQAKPLAMWLPLSAKADMARISGWYLPYFDRI
ncbi:MAG: GNAT family N-acetyltransferase [Nitrosomonadales bacterium]|nr:GNAT family N-acetyltransferase [Nitrosomonadales bacterium]